MRLVPLNATAVPTAVCDDVHFGGVELFREGIWGRICLNRFGGEEEEFTVDAQVVCRQLGFPFNNVMDVGEVLDTFEYRTYNYFPPDDPVVGWATQV